MAWAASVAGRFVASSEGATPEQVEAAAEAAAAWVASEEGFVLAQEASTAEVHADLDR